MTAGSVQDLADSGRHQEPESRRSRYRRLTPLTAVTSSPPMSGTHRLIAAGYVVALLVVSLVGQVFGLADLKAVGVALFLLTAWGIGPCLLAGTMSLSAFVLASGALSFSATTIVGFAMARTGMWHPQIALFFAVVSAVVMLALETPADIRSLVHGVRSRQRGAGRPGWALLSLVGVVLIVADSFSHRGAPTPGGMLTRIDPIWYLGVLVVVASALLAWISGSSPALPLLVLAVAVIGTQAILYNAPAVMSAAKHVGVLDFISANGLGANSNDIYQAWPGLFAAGALTTGAAAIRDPMTLATWFPVALSLYTALAVRLLAGRFLRTAPQAWAAAAVATLAGSVNIVYFSPQAVGFTLCLIITALLIGTRPQDTASQVWLRYGLVAVLTCVVTITHQISPYLMVAQLAVLVIFRLIKPWWLPLAVLAPAVAWALLHRSSLGGFVSLDAIGHFLNNLSPPVHGGASLGSPLITRLVFDIPAAVLVLVGLLALLAVFRFRNRLTIGLLVTGVSAGSLFGVTNYGSEGVFRVVLFALPWLSILAVMAFDGMQVDRALSRAAIGGGLVLLFGVNAFGQTGLDWARVVRPDTTAAIRQFEDTAPPDSALLVVGTGNAIPGRVTARYNQVQYVSRDSLDNYPVVTAAYDPAQDLAQLTRTFLLQLPGVDHFALVSDSTGAWDDRYGLQSEADYRRLEQAIAGSPDWVLAFSGPTTKLYRLAGE